MPNTAGRAPAMDKRTAAFEDIFGRPKTSTTSSSTVNTETSTQPLHHTNVRWASASLPWQQPQLGPGYPPGTTERRRMQSYPVLYGSPAPDIHRNSSVTYDRASHSHIPFVGTGPSDPNVFPGYALAPRYSENAVYMAAPFPSEKEAAQTAMPTPAIAPLPQQVPISTSVVPSHIAAAVPASVAGNVAPQHLSRTGTKPITRAASPERVYDDWAHDRREDDSLSDRRSMSSVVDYLHHFDESRSMDLTKETRVMGSARCTSPSVSSVALTEDAPSFEDRAPVRKTSRASLRNAISRVSSALTLTGSRESQPHASVLAASPLVHTVPAPPMSSQHRPAAPREMSRETQHDLPRIGQVYPALLSEVAAAFSKVVSTSEHVKDGLTYADTFDGREAVDRLAAICRTNDRNLALLLGRALDAQKFFHDVTYDHRLRDSPYELYQFRDLHAVGAGISPRAGISGGDPVFPTVSNHVKPGKTHPRESESSFNESAFEDTTVYGIEGLTISKDESPFFETETGSPAAAAGSLPDENTNYPVGVFTLLTHCYSPTCARDKLCYSIACPRRLEQQARINNMSQQAIARSTSADTLAEAGAPGELWSEFVSREIYDSVPVRERKRQEVIFEVIATERQYVADMEYLRDYWIRPLSTQNLIPESRRAALVQTIFGNVLEILSINHRLAEMLVRKQRRQPVVECVGDVFLDMVSYFEPYIKYGSNQLFGKVEFEREKSINPFFARFVEDTERMAVSRKLELNGYLTKPTTRLARYPLLFGQVLKYTEESNPDSVLLPQVVRHIQNLLSRVNDATGRSENRFQLGMLNQQLVFRPGEMVDLRLKDDNRELVFRGTLKKRGGAQSESADIYVYLFDHALLLVKNKIVHKAEIHRVYRKPIPLEFLSVTVYEDLPASRLAGTRVRSISTRTTIGNHTPNGVQSGTTPKQDNKTGFPITFSHLGKKGYSITLWAPTIASRCKWFEHVEARQEIQRSRSNIFDVIPICDTLNDTPMNRITCAVPFDFGRRILYGCDDGLYISDSQDHTRLPVKVLHFTGITQVDVMEEHQILLVLAEHSVYTFALDALDPADPVNTLKRGRRVSSHTSFFKVGVCLGRTLVCIVKSGPLSSTIKTLEPIEQTARTKKQPTFRKLLQGGQDMLRVFKEFYIPTESSSIYFLKSKLCIGCTKGFEVVDLETLDTQGLLDPADTSLEFVHRRENLRPMAIYRIDGEFLLCYNEFAFYVNKNGWRTKGSWVVNWEGNPTAFAYHHPYVLAFDPSFIEVRHVESGALHQVITGNNLRYLFSDVPLVTMNQLRHQTARIHAQTVRANNMVLPHGVVQVQPSRNFPVQQGAQPVTVSVSPSPVTQATTLPSVAGTPLVPVVPPQMSTCGSPAATGSPVPSTPNTSSLNLAASSLASMSPYVSYPARLQQPVTVNPVLESLVASRSYIIFVSDASVYSVRLHGQAPPYV